MTPSARELAVTLMSSRDRCNREAVEASDVRRRVDRPLVA